MIYVFKFIVQLTFTQMTLIKKRFMKEHYNVT